MHAALLAAAWKRCRAHNHSCDSCGMACNPPRATVAPPQLIPRVLYQTHESNRSALPPRLHAATETWLARNPTYTYCFFDSAARQAYIDRHHREWPTLHEAYRGARSGAMQADLWRALVIFREGGLCASASRPSHPHPWPLARMPTPGIDALLADADADTQCLTPFDSILRSNDDAVSGVGHGNHGLEQFVLCYAPRHPLMRKMLERMLGTIHKLGGAQAVRGTDVTKVTGPYMLQRVVAEFLLESPRLPQFDDAGGTFYVRGTNRSVRVLPGKYTCGGHSPCETPPEQRPSPSLCSLCAQLTSQLLTHALHRPQTAATSTRLAATSCSSTRATIRTRRRWEFKDTRTQYDAGVCRASQSQTQCLTDEQSIDNS